MVDWGPDGSREVLVRGVERLGRKDESPWVQEEYGDTLG